MFPWELWIALLVVVLSIVQCTINVNSAELTSLHDIYISANGQDWRWSSDPEAGAVWNFSVPDPNPCFPPWQGLSCSCSTEQCWIKQMDLQYYNMVGSLSASIGNLTELTYIQLGSNHLRDGIPDTIGELINLEYLNLGYNDVLGGTIPDSIGSTKLTTLILVYNSITGTLPSSLCNLTHLDLLSINNNKIEGSIPVDIGRLTKLRELSLEYNSLSGQIPSSIGNLTSLETLEFDNNALNGTIPSEICQLKQLTVLVGAENDLSGSIPSCIGELAELTILNLIRNMLNGSVPQSAADLNVHLVQLFLNENLLSGSLPPNFFNISINSSLEHISLSQNLLTGPLPGILLPKAIRLDLNTNFFSGVIYDSLCESSVLTDFTLNNNELSGSLPSCLSDMATIQVLPMSVNQLTGSIPETFRHHYSLGTAFTLNNNLLTGSIPNSLCLWGLQDLDLSSNFLEGELLDCTRNDSYGIAGFGLQYFAVNSNLLSGSIPSYFDQLNELTALTINDNLLSGTLPTFTNCSYLEFFYLQNNQLRGQFSLTISGSISNSITYVDISNNHFSGTLPGAFFHSNSPLMSFAASGNCITGSIPNEICSVDSLLFLNLDGLATADQCRSPIFPHVKELASYSLTNDIRGGIPLCLFNMTNLQTLHISGNSIDWSFPKDQLIIGEALTELSLSHNKLTGTIPSVIQNRQWSTLDLSYNRLVGSLSFEQQNNVNTSLVLQVNRLSGAVPDSLLQLESINILTGNLFSCSWERDGLPEHDTAYKIYQCGSNSFNEASIIWLCFAVVSLVALLVTWFFRYYWYRQFLTYCKKSWDTIQSYLAVFTEDTQENYNLNQFKMLLVSVRNVMAFLTMIILVVFTPLYGILTALYKTAVHQYAWTVSAAFLSGAAPAFSLLVFFIAFIVMLFAVWLAFTDKWSWSVMKTLKFGAKNANDVVGSSNEQHHPPSICLSAILTLVVLFNCVVMVIVNGAYVVVILNYNTEIIFVAQVMTALFKLMWNDFAMRGLFLVARRVHRMTLCGQKNVMIDTLTDDRVDNDAEYVTQEMPYMTFIVLFNSIIAPCLATAAVDSNCFYNVFVAPATVSSQFPITNAILDCEESCAIVTSVSYIEVSYDPPFIYSYQCTSSILTNYASVYVFMFLMVAFIKPVALYLILRWYSWLEVGSWTHRVMDAFLSTTLKPTDRDNLARVQRKGKRVFHRERIVLRTVSKIAVFVTFGVIFPPLAVVLCVAFASETWLNLVIIGRFITLIEDETVMNQFRELLNRDCEDCTDLLLVPLVRLVVPFAALFYGFFVFDIYGDKVGFKQAIWAPVLLVMFPLLLWLGYSFYSRRMRFQIQEKSRTISSNVEMLSTDNPVQHEMQKKA